MKQNPNQIRIGDVLYDASMIHKKVIAWRIDNIFFENYVNGWKVVIKVSTPINNCLMTRRFFEADIMNMYNTPEEAEKKLSEITLKIN